MRKLLDKGGSGSCRQADPDPHETQTLNQKLRHLP
jgi:hypothetical protein